MKSEILINVNSHETTVALLENEKLVEFFIERPYDQRILGNIYRGTVRKIIPGLQAAFVDIGLKKNAFLHVDDMMGYPPEGTYSFDDDEQQEKKVSFRHRNNQSPIQNTLKEGQDILVQVIKEPISTKGPRISTSINIPGRFVVLLVGENKIGISKKINDREERSRLKNIFSQARKNNLGCIIRTVSQGKDTAQLKKDFDSLVKIYHSIINKFNSNKTSERLLYTEMNMISGVIRDIFSTDINSVVIDDKKGYNLIIKYLKELKSDLHKKVFFYRGDNPIFDNYHIAHDVEKILDRVVWLRNGAYLVIEHTEALVSIDVNSGKSIKGKDFENFIFKVNMDAAIEIARQLRLRDIGGIVVVDFIDMAIKSNQNKVFSQLLNSMKPDRAKYYVLNFSEFGLVQITRQRVRPSLLFSYSDLCPICKGLGRIDSPMTTVSKIEHWFQRAKMWLPDKKFILKINKIVYDFIHKEDIERFNQIQKNCGIKLILEDDPDLDRYEFKIINFRTEKDITNNFL